MGCVHYDMDSRSMSKGLNDFFSVSIGNQHFFDLFNSGRKRKGLFAFQGIVKWKYSQIFIYIV